MVSIPQTNHMLSILGEMVSSDALPPLVGASPAPTNVSTFITARSPLLCVAPEKTTPRVVVIGTSPTAGCGACDGYNAGPLENSTLRKDACQAIVGNRTSSCVVSHSWASQLAHGLSELGWLAHVDVWFKNAVGPGYFTRCTSQFVPANTRVVLLEIATNVWGGSPSELVQAIKRAAPLAAIAFVVWPTQDRNQAAWALNIIKQASKESSVDMLRVDRILPREHGSYYAKEGRDKVHPSALGHALLANTAARFLAHQFMSALPCNNSIGDDLIGALAAPYAAPGAALHWERCFADARVLPTTPPNNGSLTKGSWRLAEEGFAFKGVEKWGYVSETVGSALTVGPLVAPQEGNLCELLLVEIGYHLQPRSSTQRQGALSLRCTGCECSGNPTAFTRSITPFPIVQTDAALARDQGLRRNVSVTATTSFEALWHAGTTCHDVGKPAVQAR